MKKTPYSESDEMLSEYRFDYRKARPNRFAGVTAKNKRVIILDPDIAEVFNTSESVNNILRAIIAAMPESQKEMAH